MAPQPGPGRASLRGVGCDLGGLVGAALGDMDGLQAAGSTQRPQSLLTGLGELPRGAFGRRAVGTGEQCPRLGILGAWVCGAQPGGGREPLQSRRAGGQGRSCLKPKVICQGQGLVAPFERSWARGRRACVREQGHLLPGAKSMETCHARVTTAFKPLFETRLPPLCALGKAGRTGPPVPSLV